MYYFFLRWYKKEPTSLQREDLVDFFLFLKKQGKAPKTINLYKFAIIKFCEDIFDLHFKNIPLSSERKKLPVVLSKEEVQRVIQVVENKKHRLILQIAYGGGLRISEVLSLKLQDLDFSRGVIHIKLSK